MRVLKPGDLEQTRWSQECSCTGKGNGRPGCGALLLVEQGDLFKTTSQARDETTTYITFSCPECGTLTDIVGVPDYIQASLPTRHPVR
jgi:hypothetical protein